MRVFSINYSAHRSLIAFIMTTCSMFANAQSKSVIIDKETGIPIRDVKVITNNGLVAISDYQGQISLDSTFMSATISHVSYLARTIDHSEWRDTIWLLPKDNRLGEVVVWGKARKNIQDMTSIVLNNAASQATPPPGGVSFDFFGMFQKKPLNKKTRRKNEKLLRDWDKIYENKSLYEPKTK